MERSFFPSVKESHKQALIEFQLYIFPCKIGYLLNSNTVFFMIFFIPIFAVIYRFVKEWVEKHEQEQAAPVVAVGGVVDEEN